MIRLYMNYEYFDVYCIKLCVLVNIVYILEIILFFRHLTFLLKSVLNYPFIYAYI